MDLPTLHNISLKVEEGSLVAVVGQVGLFVPCSLFNILLAKKYILKWSSAIILSKAEQESNQ